MMRCHIRQLMADAGISRGYGSAFLKGRMVEILEMGNASEARGVDNGAESWAQIGVMQNGFSWRANRSKHRGYWGEGGRRPVGISGNT